MRLNGYLGTFRKSHKVSVVKFDPEGSNYALNVTWVFMLPPVSNRVNNLKNDLVIQNSCRTYFSSVKRKQNDQKC